MNDIKDKTELADNTCEQLVLGTVMNNESALAEAVGLLSERSFADWHNRQLWQLIVTLYRQGSEVNVVSIGRLLASHTDMQVTMAYLAQVATECVVSGTLQDYLLRLKELEQRRALKYVGIKIQSLSNDESTPVDEALSNARQLIDDSLSDGKNSVITLQQASEQMLQQLQERINGKAETGTMTGFHAIDSHGGLRPSDLVIIAGCTSQGKTAFATSLALHAIQTGSKVAFYSLEMTAVQLAARMTAMCSHVSASTISYQHPSNSDMAKIQATAHAMPKDSLYFDDNSTSSIDKILASIRRMKIRYGIDGAVVDYLQILNVNMRTANKEQQMADVARRLKNLAKELGIWIIALSQLNRNKENPEPTIDRLRDSGQIAEAADIVLLIYRPEYYGQAYLPKSTGRSNDSSHNKAVITVAKGRNIGTFQFVCDFTPELTLFSDEAQPHDEVILSAQPVQQEADSPYGDVPF